MEKENQLLNVYRSLEKGIIEMLSGKVTNYNRKLGRKAVYQNAELYKRSDKKRQLKCKDKIIFMESLKGDNVKLFNIEIYTEQKRALLAQMMIEYQRGNGFLNEEGEDTLDIKYTHTGKDKETKHYHLLNRENNNVSYSVTYKKTKVSLGQSELNFEMQSLVRGVDKKINEKEYFNKIEHTEETLEQDVIKDDSSILAEPVEKMEIE